MHGLTKLVCFLWDGEALRDEVALVVTMNLLHLLDSLCQKVFSSELSRPRELVNLLMLLKHGKSDRFQGLGAPQDEPIGMLPFFEDILVDESLLSESIIF